MGGLTRLLIGDAKTADAAREAAERLLAGHVATFEPDPPGYHVLTGPRLDLDELIDRMAAERTDSARCLWFNQIPPKIFDGGA
ncbi:hypothetical protein ACWEFJ_28385 [Actinosynnema sp. NPDC004786]